MNSGDAPALGGAKTREELCLMPMRESRAYAKEIGCCLGYAGTRKDSAIQEVVAFQRHMSRAEAPVEGGGDEAAR